MSTAAFLPLLANHVWQSTLFVLFAALLALALRRSSARARYWIWWMASLKFLIPFSLLVGLGSIFSWRTAPAVSIEPSVSAVVFEQVAQPFSAADPGRLMLGVTQKAAPTSRNMVLVPIAALWVLGCGLVSVRWFRRLRKVSTQRMTYLTEGREVGALRQLEERIGRRSPLAVATSAGAVEPCVLGLFQPVLIWPTALSNRLSDEELEAILLHELSHVRHRDNLTAVWQMIVQALFWFHPLTWWIGARLVEERENACDEDVLRFGSASQQYAEGILKVCDFCLESPLPCAPGVSGSNLKKRIQNIMSARITRRLSWMAALLLVSMALTVSAGPIAWGLIQVKPIAAALESLEASSEKLTATRTVAAPAPVTPVPTAVPAPVLTPMLSPRVPQNPRDASPTFDVVSIRPSSGPPGGGLRGGGPGARGGGPAGPTACGGAAQVNPGRFIATNVSLHRLINLATGRNCRLADEQKLVSGLPDWAQSVAFDIQATLPAGTPAYTTSQLLFGEAPQLQMMIQNMLADRFQLAMHRETKEIPIFNLVTVKLAKIKLSDDQTPPPPPAPPTGPPPPGEPPPFPRGAFQVGVDPPAGIVRLRASSIPISTMINFYQGGVGRMVIDKTELKGLYDIPEVSLNVGPFDIGPGSVTVWPEIMLQLGLRMDASRGPVEALVIDKASRPTEN